MSTVSLRIPNFLHKEVKEIAKHEGISINHFISTALAEKLSALKTEEYLENRANRASRDKFEAALSKVGNNHPLDEDDVELSQLTKKSS
ncbi:MAG: toxin-antitoxin system HicB family antitoxin [Gammaproteobacteria bacterium]|nr:toxin-antitoxin system HicB family antitoxin [Gammaproteobacteria bacterium]